METDPLTERKKRILSGNRPTNFLHLGNYVGALSNWVKLQDEYDCYFMVADWHALMSEYKNPGDIGRFTREMYIDWLSVGLDPERCVMFVQSDVPQHAELHLILSAYCPIGWLERCPTYKEQMENLKHKEINNYAFLGYPLLQTADIVLYDGEVVPVGQDQLPHLELAREIVRRFNGLVDREVLLEPEAKLTEFPLLLGVDNRKMSKSYDNFILLSEPEDSLRKKVMSMITDPARVKKTDKGHPEVCNVCSYYKIFSPHDVPEVEDNCRNAAWGCTDCKRRLADRMVEYLAPVHEKRRELEADPGALDAIIEDGNTRARKAAAETMGRVREALGF